ncbi:TPA: HNH endonuclease [Klebsiella variicola]|nr:HNH endonuclease [Klebsiella variicola]
MANVRVKPSEHEHSILYAETGGSCPLCKSAIMSKKPGSNKPISLYEIAHIYPLNPNNSQSTALQNYPLPQDINSLENYILLCPSCHTNYDKDFKIEEYLYLLNIKKGFLNEAKAKVTASQYALQEEVNEILDQIASDDCNYEDLSDSEFNVSSIDKKLKSSISPLLKREIRYNIIDFFVPIRNHIHILEQKNQLSVKILQSQIHTFYLVMQQQHPDNKDLVFKYISEWISQRSGKSLMASKILTSFFIQSCEVFDVSTK